MSGIPELIVNVLAEEVFSALARRLDEEGVRLLVLYSWLVSRPGEESGEEVIALALKSLHRPTH